MEILDLDLGTAPHVYPVREDSFLLARAARVEPSERVLEVGCGTGLSALSAARAGAEVVASDVNPYALEFLRRASSQRGLVVTGVRADLLGAFRAFDVVLFNPPYLPTRAGEEDPDPWIDRALNGGPDGHDVLRRFLRELPGALSLRGRCYVVVASVRGAPPPAWARLAPSSATLSRPREVLTRRLEGERLSVFEISRAPDGGS